MSNPFLTQTVGKKNKFKASLIPKYFQRAKFLLGFDCLGHYLRVADEKPGVLP